jgi:hypothetical protein
MMTLFKFMLGDFDKQLPAMLETSPMISFLGFLIFMVLFYLFLVNMYLATMMATYSDITAQKQIEKAERIVGEFRESRRKRRKEAAEKM